MFGEGKKKKKIVGKKTIQTNTATVEKRLNQQTE